MARIPISVEVRFLRIPTEWKIGDATYCEVRDAAGRVLSAQRTERFADPRVTLDPNVWAHQCERIDGWYLRERFFKLRRADEASLLEFLNDVGVWQTVPTGEELSGAFGSRYFQGRPIQVRLDEFFKEQASWRKTMLEGTSSRHFAEPPSKKAPPLAQLVYAVEAHFANEMPLRLEWQNDKPVGVIETITGWELMTATTHVDLLRGASFKACARKDCGNPFPVLPTNQNKMYCQQYCAHIESVRRGRRKEKRHGKKR